MLTRAEPFSLALAGVGGVGGGGCKHTLLPSQGVNLLFLNSSCFVSILPDPACDALLRGWGVWNAPRLSKSWARSLVVSLEQE